MEELSGSNASLKKMFEKKVQGFVDEVENNHMVWLQEILEEAAKMFSSNFSEEPELMPKTPTQKKREKKKRSFFGRDENQIPSRKRDKPDTDVVSECLSVVEEAKDVLITQRATQSSSKRNAEKCSSPHEGTTTNDQNKGNSKAEHSTDLKKRHGYKGTKAELNSQGEDCQADKPVSPVKKSLPVVTVPKGYSAMKPHMKSFLHTVPRNQLLMSTPNSLCQSTIVKSFIKHTTPLKVDTKEKGRQHLEMLKKKKDQEIKRLKKMEDEKKWKLEEMKREQELLEKEKAIAVQLKVKRAVEEMSALEAAREKDKLQKQTVEREKLRACPTLAYKLNN
ncbi:inner centromere protein-like [Erpetoichthys calabaricus]|uniref:inner centromere protein-like n=1 Tax=Erpetoichthys calabaricus TaxID=27687 RepID=UPI002233EC68|nr:inner centromere protein-like [Erpetoichthys calabaricus]